LEIVVKDHTIRVHHFVILPIIPAFIPLKFHSREPPLSDLDIDLSVLDPAQFSSIVTLLMDSEEDEVDKVAKGKSLQLKIGLFNFIKFLPALISFPASLFCASLRIKGLLPKSSLSNFGY
jgi:hypothetical protein